MSDYEQKLRQAGIDVLFQKLGWSFEEIMVKPAENVKDDPYAEYRFLILRNHHPAMANGQVAFALPPAEKIKELPWEEWFILDGKEYHQVFYWNKVGKCDLEWTAPDKDEQHPDQILGIKWNYYIDSNKVPALLQK